MEHTDNDKSPAGAPSALTDQTYRQKFMETFRGKCNLSCYVWYEKISSFADPKIENFYIGWKLGFIQGRNEPPNIKLSAGERREEEP